MSEMEKVVGLVRAVFEIIKQLMDGNKSDWLLLVLAILSVYAGSVVAWGYRLLRERLRTPHRRFLKVRELLTDVEDYSPVSGFLHQSRDLEAFQVAAGIRADWRSLIAFAHLCECGLLSPNTLKGLSRFLVLGDDGTISVKTGIVDRCFYDSLLLYICVTFLGGVLLWAGLSVMYFQRSDSILGIFIGAIPFLGFLVGSLLLMGEIGIYRRAVRLQADLDKYEVPICQALVRPIRARVE